MGPEATPASSDVKDQVRRIRESDTFRSAPQISRLLTFLTDATLDGEPLKESVIGAAFFNRPSGYDPQTDPVVRTEVRRLRLKLNEYYQKEGSDAPVLIEIPSGGYKARFVAREISRPQPAPEVPPPPVIDAGVGSKRRALPGRAIAAAAVLIIGAAVWLLPRVAGHASSTPRSVAVLRLRDLNSSADTVWLGNALSEMLTADFSANTKLHSIPIDDVARSRLNLSLADTVTLGPAELKRIRQTLDADLVVAGSYASIGTSGSREYRIDIQIYDARTGKLAGSASDTCDEKTLFDMVTRVGARIGREVGVETADARPLRPGEVRFDGKGLAGVELARTLCLKAAFLPPGADKERLYLQALEVGRKEGSGAWEVDPLVGLGHLYAGGREFEKAADFYHQAYDVSRKFNGPDHPSTAEAEVHWARSRTRLGQGKQAVEQIREAIPVARRGLPPDSLRLWDVLHDAIHACNEAKAFQDAETYTLEALAVNQRMHLPPTSERWGMLYWDLGRAKKGEKQYGEALTALAKAEADFQQFPDTRTMQVRADIDQVKAEQRSAVARTK